MSRTPKWIRRQRRRFRGSSAQYRDLRWLWRGINHPGREGWGEIMGGGIGWHPAPGVRS